MPVNPINEALGSASWRFRANPSMKSYWLRCASSAMTTMFCRGDNSGYSTPFSSGRNFCIVVKTTPPEATCNRLFRLSRLSACTGVCLNKAWQFENVPKSWSSRSFLSVITTSVGFSIAGCLIIFPAKYAINRLFPLPWVCQITPIRRSPKRRVPEPFFSGISDIRNGLYLS